MTVTYLIQRYSGHDVSCVLSTHDELERDRWLNRLRNWTRVEAGVGYEPDCTVVGDLTIVMELELEAMRETVA